MRDRGTSDRYFLVIKPSPNPIRKDRTEDKNRYITLQTIGIF